MRPAFPLPLPGKFSSSSRIKRSTSIPGSVMVPVLSTQSVFYTGKDFHTVYIPQEPAWKDAEPLRRWRCLSEDTAPPDHPDKRGNRRLHSPLHRKPQHLMLIDEKTDPYGNGCIPITRISLSSERIISDFPPALHRFSPLLQDGKHKNHCQCEKPGNTPPAVYKAARLQLVPGLSAIVGFPRKQRLIHSYLPGANHGIRTNLAPVIKFHNIVPHQL